MKDFLSMIEIILFLSCFFILIFLLLLARQNKGKSVQICPKSYKNIRFAV